MKDFRPHEIAWTREKASRFWQFMAARPSEETNYFSYTVGAHVISEARRHGVPLEGRVLDYGCGPGHLLKHLIGEGVPCEGADFDTVALERAKVRIGESPLFRGTTLISGLPSQLRADAYDVVFFVETIEHLVGDELGKTLAELHRILRPGGFVVITTPNEEDLEAQKKMCPDCGCVFHIVQHVTRWDRESLSTIVREHGFEPLTTAVLKFRRPSRLNWVKKLADHVLARTPPHLMLVGRKPR